MNQNWNYVSDASCQFCGSGWDVICHLEQNDDGVLRMTAEMSSLSEDWREELKLANQWDESDMYWNETEKFCNSYCRYVNTIDEANELFYEDFVGYRDITLGFETPYGWEEEE